MRRKGAPLVEEMTRKITQLNLDQDEDMSSNPESPRLYRELIGNATPRKKARIFEREEPHCRKENKSSMKSGGPSRFETQFECLGLLGCGNFGEVNKCRNVFDQKIYAVKSVKFNGRSALNEIRALARLCAEDKEESLVRYHGAWREEDVLFIQMEFCPGSLKGLKGEKVRLGEYFSEGEILRIMRGILLGLCFLHRQNIAHLDIKPENILLGSRGEIKIADLGLSRIASQSEFFQEGDSRYMAADLLNPSPDLDLRTSDIFSFGLSILQLLMMVDSLPNNGDDWGRLRNNFRPSKLKELSVRYSQPLLQLLDQTLQRLDRPTAKELLASPVFAHKTLTAQRKKGPRKLSL